MNLIQWLEARGIETEIATGLGLREAKRSGKTWVEIPFFRNGEEVNVKHRSLEDKQFFQQPDATKCFYNEDIIRDTTLYDTPLIITEGEFDAIAAIQCGYVKTVSVPNGAPNEQGIAQKHYDYLDSLVAHIRQTCPYVILAVDNDKNGNNLFHDLSHIIGRDICKWVKYPKECKDLNDALMKYGHAGVVKSIETQRFIDIDGVYKMDDLPPVKDATSYSSCFDGLDFNLRLGDFSVVTGIPSMGKSTFVNDLMARVNMRHKVKICFASFEQHPSLDHLRNLRKIKDDKKWINDNFVFVYPSEKQQLEDELTLDWFFEKASVAIKQHGAQIIVLDPWNELEHNIGNQSLTEYTGACIRRIKRFAKINNVHFMVVAHPTKLLRDKDGAYPMPSLYNISDSAHWANKADLGMVVHRENYESTDTVIAILKSRYHDVIGKPARSNYKFNTVNNKFMWADM